MVINLKLLNITRENLTGGIIEFHGKRTSGMASSFFSFSREAYANSHFCPAIAFWNGAYSKVTKWVSDPTHGDNPIGVQFYDIGKS